MTWRNDIDKADLDGCIVCATLFHSDKPAVGEAHWVANEDREGGGDWWWANQDSGDYHAEPIQGRVTHWMPLPEPPTGVHGEDE